MVEIERKFLVKDLAGIELGAGTEIVQGYVCVDRCACRVRIADGRGLLGLKSAVPGATRAEFEYEIPVGEARQMIETFCDGRVIQKTRYRVFHERHEWEIDCFHGKNEGLIVAEIELSDEGEEFELPKWLGREVTEQSEYYNAALACR